MTIEEMQEALLKEQEKNTELATKLKASEDKNKELEESNKRLTDYNNKLFMRVTNPAQQEDNEQEEELTAEEMEAKQIEDIRNLMKDRRN